MLHGYGELAPVGSNLHNFMSIYEVYRDIAEASQLGFQDPASPIMEEIINFHNYVMVYLSFIGIGLG
jgi:heme/copper-type cytochrome/quinol oxidase subunit 2